MIFDELMDALAKTAGRYGTGMKFARRKANF